MKGLAVKIPYLWNMVNGKTSPPELRGSVARSEHRRDGHLRSLFLKISGLLKRNSFLALTDQVAASGTNFLTGVIIGRVCVREEFGFYMLCLSIVLFAADLQASLISAPYMVYSQRLSGIERARYAGSSLFHQLLFSLFLILLLALGAQGYTFIFGPRPFSAVLWVLVLVIACIMFREYIRKVCFASMMMRSALIIDICTGLLQVTALSALALFGLLSAKSAYWVIGAATGFTSFGWLYINRNRFQIHLASLLPDFWKNWAFGKWVFGSGLLWALSMNSYPWLLAAFHGASETAVWGACFGVAALGNPLLLGIQNFLGPKIINAHTRGGMPLLKKFVMSSTILFLLIVMPFSMVLVSVGDHLVELIYGHKYAGHHLVVIMLAFNLLVSAASFTLSRAFFAVERADLFFRANFVSLAVMLTLGVMLVKILGPLGVACSLLITSVATSVVMFFLFLNVMKSDARTKDA